MSKQFQYIKEKKQFKHMRRAITSIMQSLYTTGFSTKIFNESVLSAITLKDCGHLQDYIQSTVQRRQINTNDKVNELL